MIQITPQMRILLAVEPADFRKGIDGLAAVCREKLSSEPMEGAVFVFRSRSAKALKILVYDGQGFWLCQKRLSKGRFHWWPQQSGQGVRTLDAHQLQLLLWNGNPQGGQTAPMWRRLGANSGAKQAA
jgi:transposase